MDFASGTRGFGDRQNSKRREISPGSAARCNGISGFKFAQANLFFFLSLYKFGNKVKYVKEKEKIRYF